MTTVSEQDTTQLLRLAIGPACHELRSPLAVVYGFARMLEGNEELSAAHQKYIEQIALGAERLDTMLDDLAKLGRVASSRMKPVIEEVSLREVAQDMRSKAINEKRVRVESDTDLKVAADFVWLKESLLSLVDGLCFEEIISVSVSWRAQNDNVLIQVVPSSSFPMVDVEPEKASLSVALARMRIVAMGGVFAGEGDRITITLPAK